MTIGMRVPDCTGRRSTVTDTGGTVFSLGGDQPDVVLASCTRKIEIFRNLCGGGDRIISHDMIIDLLCGVGGKLISTFVEFALGSGFLYESLC